MSAAQSPYVATNGPKFSRSLNYVDAYRALIQFSAPVDRILAHRLKLKCSLTYAADLLHLTSVQRLHVAWNYWSSRFAIKSSFTHQTQTQREANKVMT